MESRFNHNPEEEGEKQWVSPLPHNPPASSHIGNHSGLRGKEETALPQKNTGSLCVRVSEMLPSLIEGDGEIRPEMATAIYGHLAVCPTCAKEFDTQQRTLMLLEQLPLLELPKDFSGLVMSRVQAEMGNYKDGVLQHRQTSGTETLSRLALGEETAVVNTQTAALYGHLDTKQRAVLTGVFAALLVFFLSSAWGKAAMGGNAEAIVAWLSGVGEAARSLPIIGQTMGSAFSSLSQMATTIEESYATLGATAAQGLAIDVALGAAAFVVYTRRQKSRSKMH
ncbi:MAG: hypothetical protein H7308_03285 [Chthonomonadaceae bacterium]|nr:hypothetical protein [Chthonomonadaceae bacterium]